MDESIPKSSRSVLRGVFDGLSEGVHAIASAGSAAVSDVRGRAPAAAGRNMSHATTRIRAANDEFPGERGQELRGKDFQAGKGGA